MKIRAQDDYTLQQPVVMLSGERITGYGLKENIKLTEDNQIQLLEWLKENKPEFLFKIVCTDKEFCYKGNVLDYLCQKSSD